MLLIPHAGHHYDDYELEKEKGRSGGIVDSVLHLVGIYGCYRNAQENCRNKPQTQHEAPLDDIGFGFSVHRLRRDIHGIHDNCIAGTVNQQQQAENYILRHKAGCLRDGRIGKGIHFVFDSGHYICGYACDENYYGRNQCKPFHRNGKLIR